MSREPDIYERAEAAIAEGKLWRAKEILRGNIRERGYDRYLFERYGQLLLRLGETIEAGKYLFLSAERKPEYEEAIRLYLARYTRKAPRNLIGTFPLCARLLRVDAYPEAVRGTLRELGFKDGPLAPPPQPASRASRWAQRILACGCFLLIACAFLLAFLGIGIATDWILENWF